MEALAEKCLGTNRYTREEVLSQPSQFLTVEIRDGKPILLRCERLASGEMEERQGSLFKILQEVCEKYPIKDLVLCYCTHDRTQNENAPVFTHARRRGATTRNILAPCFTFSEYPEKGIMKSWDTSWKELNENFLPWTEKEETCMFVGSVTKENGGLENVDISLPIPFLIANQQADSPQFIERYAIGISKYLLHLNGHNGAYASRLKYLLGTGSLVFYITKSGSETNFWEEWWMLGDNPFVVCSTKEEFRDKLMYYMEHDLEANRIGMEGRKFFKEMLRKERVLEFWAALLNAYADRF